MNNRKISAVVVTYNRKMLLVECIEALFRQTCRLLRICIVDNASTDGTEARLREGGYLGRPDIAYVRLPENMGGAGGFYHGMKTEYDNGSDWIWLMDDDSEPRPDALEKMATLIDRSIGAGIMVPKVVDRHGDIELDARGILRFGDSYKTMFRKPLDGSGYDQAKEIGFASFVGPMVSRSLIAKAGLPDPNYFIYHDDVEFSIRTRESGYKMILVPDSVIIHKEGRYGGDVRKGLFLWMESSTSRLKFENYWRAYYSTRNLIYLCKKYQDNRMRFYMELIVALLRTVGGVLLYDDMKLERIRLVIRSCIDGFSGRLGKRVDPAEWRNRHE